MRVSRLRAAVAAASVCLTAQPAFAQDSFRQTVVVTAAATPVELGTVTRTLTVITREQIDALPVQSIADVLRLVASVDVRARGDARRPDRLRGARRELRSDARARRRRAPERRAVGPPQRRHPGAARRRGADRDPARPGLVAVRRRRLRRHGQRDHAPHGAAAVAASSRAAASARLPCAAQVGFERGAVREALVGVPSIDRPASCTTATSRRRSCARAPRSATTRACRCRISGRSSAPTTSTAATRRRASGPTRRWSRPIIGSARPPAGARAPSPRIARTAIASSSIRQLPLLSDNRHRTHAVLGDGQRRAACRRDGTVTVGVEGGGDWIRSTNLGDHDRRASAASASGGRRSAGRAQLDATLRVDRYSSSARRGIRRSASAGGRRRACGCARRRGARSACRRSPSATTRIPPTWRARRSGRRRAWAGEGGADVFLAGGWVAPGDGVRPRRSDVIDWLRPTPADRWQTYNVRDVDTRGVELGVRKTFARRRVRAGGVTPALDLDAAGGRPAVEVRARLRAALVRRGRARFRCLARFASRRALEYRRRSRSDRHVRLRAARRARRPARRRSSSSCSSTGRNLLDEAYQEIAGVAMPGAAVAVPADRRYAGRWRS